MTVAAKPIPASVTKPVPAAPKTPPRKHAVAPGLYPRVSFEDYQAIDAVNNSSIKDYRTPAHILSALSGLARKKETKNMILGRALHYLMLELVAGEPSRLLNAPINPRTEEPFGADSKAYKSFVAMHPDKIVLGADMPEKLEGMSETLLKHPEAGACLRAKGETELVLVWDEPVTLPGGDRLSVRCKARIDRYIRGLLATDLKSTEDASPPAWSNAVNEYGYARQMDFYRRGMNALDIGGTPFAFIVCENVHPYPPVIYEIEPETAQWAKFENDQALAIVAACQRANSWPGYPTGVQQIGYPLWKLKQLEEAHQ